MANAQYIQDKIYYGYGKAAIRLGTPYSIYRPVSPFYPLDPAHKIGEVFSSFNVSWDYMRANNYSNAVWQTVADGREFQKGDYLAGSGKYNTFFVIGMELMLPIISVECNKVVTIERPAQAQTPGFNGYAGYEPVTSTILAQNVPVSILYMNKGTNNRMQLPTDSKLPVWTLLLPDIAGVVYKNGDIVIDDLNMRYNMISPELTEFGWRILVELLGA